MKTFVAIYRGDTISDAKVVAVSIDPGLVGDVATRLLGNIAALDTSPDPVLAAVNQGRQTALKMISEAADERQS